MANADPLVPSSKPIATARAVTVAECEDGIPPEPINRLESHLFSLNLCVKDNWLKSQGSAHRRLSTVTFVNRSSRVIQHLNKETTEIAE